MPFTCANRNRAFATEMRLIPLKGTARLLAGAQALRRPLRFDYYTQPCPNLYDASKWNIWVLSGLRRPRIPTATRRLSDNPDSIKVTKKPAFKQLPNRALRVLRWPWPAISNAELFWVQK